MFLHKEKKASVPEIVFKNIELPQIVTQKLHKQPAAAKRDPITCVLEYEHTPIIAAAAIGFLAGVIVGFAVSPVKHGVNMFSANQIDSHECTDQRSMNADEDMKELDASA